METSLIIGDGCVENLERIFKAYKSKKEEQAQSFYEDKTISFKPIFGNEDFYRKLSAEQIKNLLDCGDVCNDSFLYFAQYEMLFEKFGLNEYFFGPLSGVHIIDPKVYSENSSEIQEALRLISDSLPWMGRLYKAVISDLVFVQKAGESRFVGGGASEYNFIGLIMMSLRPSNQFSEIDLAISIAHELGHNCFFLLQAGMLPVREEDWGKKIYSGIKKVRRPVYASLHAIVALMYMLVLVRSFLNTNSLSNNPISRDHLCKKKTEFETGLESGLEALSEVKLTRLGSLICFEALRLLKSKID